MKQLISIFCILILTTQCKAQKGYEMINAREVERIESVLASDEMRGRKTGTPDIDRAADFIADEFKKAGLQPLKGKGFLQQFSIVRSKIKSLKVDMDGADIDQKKIVISTVQDELKLDEKSGYEIMPIKAGENFRTRAQQINGMKKNALVFVDTSFARSFPRLAGLGSAPMAEEEKKSSANIVYILGIYEPKEYKIKAEMELTETKYSNVVGILPGKTKKDEYVIFSGHYDHLGIDKRVTTGDGIYNGANDDAAGTTAVIMLANYFKKQNNNDRTLVFAAFTAEEIGGFGSQYFSRQFDPAKVMAMFNIEMIGTESKWGKNSAYITGFEKTDMGEILQRNLEGTAFTLYPDPYTSQNLFYRSDNATLARLGVPAHTISTSKMDTEPNYHKLSDEVSTLDMENMTEVIKAIAMSSKSIISGKGTPKRVKVEDLR